jgi:hypothetical protein
LLLGMAVAVPTHHFYRPLITTSWGLGILAAACVLILLVVFLAESGARFAGRGRVGPAIALGIASFAIAFVATWLVLLGPAIAVLLTS